MRILILGGTGAMGTPLVNLLSEDNKNEIYVTSRKEHSSCGNIHYIICNAKDLSFCNQLLSEEWDAIFDFMVYSTQEFADRYLLFLAKTKQYFFFSSSRCYANTTEPINENSPRLVDVCTDKEYLATDEYGLAKGREENFLFSSGKTNWTIIRPYITYNVYRLQLGVFEKEQWLWRLLNGRTIVVPADILNHYTSLTYGDDVAKSILGLINNPKALGQAFHITVDKAYKWQDILDLYIDVVRREKGIEPKVKIVDDSTGLCKVWNKWQIKYDRLFDRKFNNQKINDARGSFEYLDSKMGIEKCLIEFLKNPKWLNINPAFEAWCDRQTHERTPLSQIFGIKNKLRYIKYRYFFGKNY